MPTLRDRLQLESSELSAALTRSWEIAQKEWLPAVSPSEGSYNSLPHFRNIEYHLDTLLGAAAASPAATIRLSTLELYLLLAAVLFHDYGRVHGDADHALASERELPRFFAALGIPNRELALCLSRIALYHEPVTSKDDDAKKKKASIKKAKWALRDVRIEPFGTASELRVGTLLSLADHMDGSVRRAVPEYVRPDDVVGFKGAFRRMVSGMGYDPATYTLKTTLSGFDEDPRPFDLRTIYENFQYLNGNEILSAERDADPEHRCDLFESMLRGPRFALSKLFRRFLAQEHGNDRVKLRRKADTTSPWPADYLLAFVLNDLVANRKFLDLVSLDLGGLGLPIDGWYVEFGSDVFDTVGKRVCEPVFESGRLLERVADEMWKLRSRLFVRGLTTYETLADSLRMENVALVSLAVRRIANAFNDPGNERIIADTMGWRFGDKFEKEVLDNCISAFRASLK